MEKSTFCLRAARIASVYVAIFAEKYIY